jgi:HSP20 family protein
VAGRRRHIGDLQGEIQELFAELWQVPRYAGMPYGFRPQADCYRTDDPPALHVVLELPGVDPDAIEIGVAGRALLVAGTRVRPPGPTARYHQMEIDYGPFQRRIDLAEEVDTDRAEARYEAGMLRIELPLASAPPPRQTRVAIEVRRR